MDGSIASVDVLETNIYKDVLNENAEETPFVFEDTTEDVSILYYAYNSSLYDPESFTYFCDYNRIKALKKWF